MTDNGPAPETANAKAPSRLWRLGVLTAVAVGIATALWWSNGGVTNNLFGGSGGSCTADPAVRERIDQAAAGELAAFRATAEGRDHNDLRFQSPEGQTVGFAALPEKVRLVNFWASWCAPCRAEMPALSAIEEKFGGKNFEVTTINLDIGDDGIGKARQFIAETGTGNLPLYADQTFKSFDTLKQKGVAIGLPATLLLSPKGCEWGVLAGPAEWDTPDGHGLIEAAIDLARQDGSNG